MTPQLKIPGTSKVFYGWFALAGTMLIAFVNTGSFLYAFGVFMPVISAELDWGRVEVSMGLFAALLCFGGLSPLWGVVVSKFGPRATLVVGNALVALSLAGLSRIQESWHLYALYSLTGIGVGLGVMIPCSTIINNWFIRKRALAFGMFTACGGLGGFVFAPLVTYLISSAGWRTSYVVLGAIVLAVSSLTAGLILIRNRPEDMGQVPDGISADPDAEAGQLEAPSGSPARKTGQAITQILKTPATWMIAAITLAFSFVQGTINTHQVAHVQDLGFSPMIAATTLSLVAGTSILGSLGFGTLSLKFKIKNLVVIFFGTQLIGLAILLTTQNLALIYVYAALLGISNGALLTSMPTFVGAFYDRVNYSRVLGMMLLVQTVSISTATAAGGAIYDATATYTPAFAIMAAFSLIGFISACMLRPPELPHRKDRT